MLQTFTSGGRPIRLRYTGPTPANPVAPTILLLHGAGGNLDLWFDRIGPTIARMGVSVYAVHYFDRTGTTRADPTILRDGKHVPLWIETIRDCLAYIAQQSSPSSKTLKPPRIALLGISLGAFLALGLATQPLPTPIRCIVDLSGGLEPPFDTQATAAFPPTLILHGDADPIVPVANAHTLDALLNRLHVSHQVEIFPGEGHWFSAASQIRILGLIATFLGQYL